MLGKKRKHTDVLATWRAPRAPTLVSRLQICSSIVNSGCWKGELSSSRHRAQRTHWCNEARASLAFKCYASMGPDQKTNGDRSPIRPERDEVKRVWLQLHKYLAQCQFDVRICRVSWAAQGCTGPCELHCSPWTGWGQAPAFPSQLLQCLG